MTDSTLLGVDALVDEASRIVDQAIETHVTGAGKELAAVCVLFSGGNDSTVLAHLMRHRATHAIHANTGIGVEATRQFVRDQCADWGLPLIERSPDAKDSYESLVLDRGFPGPGQHYKMYQRLKERALRKARNELVGNPRDRRVVFLAGRRRDESDRRMHIPHEERQGSIVWVSPIAHWTAMDMNAYRAANEVPRNEVADVLHMSGECLCGAFAKAGELDEVGFWFPEVQVQIRGLEDRIRDRTDIPDHHKTWGWGGDPDKLRAARAKAKSGLLCSSCVQLSFPIDEATS